MHRIDLMIAVVKENAALAIFYGILLTTIVSKLKLAYLHKKNRIANTLFLCVVLCVVILTLFGKITIPHSNDYEDRRTLILFLFTPPLIAIVWQLLTRANYDDEIKKPKAKLLRIAQKKMLA